MSCPRLEHNLRTEASNLVQWNMDFVLPIVGQERSGKSNLGLYCCVKLQELEYAMGYRKSPHFDIDKQVFHSAEGFLKGLQQLEKGSAVLLDEGGELLYSRDWQSPQNKILTKIFMICGEKNLFIVFIIPAFASIDKYLRTHRANALLKTGLKMAVGKDGLKHPQRGRFASYGKQKLLQIKTQMGTGVTVFPQPDFVEYVPSMAKAYPEYWKAYEELSVKRKAIMLRKALQETKGKTKFDEEGNAISKKEKVNLPEVEF